MNPENQPNQQKPNLERIAEIIAPEWASDNPEALASVIESWVNKLQKEWENIEKGKISYPDNPLLEEMLNEYHLELLLPDFRFLGFMFNKWISYNINFKSFSVQMKGFSLELIQALKLFHDFPKGITINLIRKQKIQASIQNHKLIEIIIQFLFEYFKEHDFYLEKGKPYPEEITDWGAYIQKRFTEEKARISQKGRKKGNYQIKRITFFLWKYLQEYTEIKGEAGAGYSNEQARFIFSFLEIHGLIENPDLITRKEDIIAYYLKAYKQSRIKNQNLQSGK